MIAKNKIIVSMNKEELYEALGQYLTQALGKPVEVLNYNTATPLDMWADVEVKELSPLQ